MANWTTNWIIYSAAGRSKGDSGNSNRSTGSGSSGGGWNDFWDELGVGPWGFIGGIVAGVALVWVAAWDSNREVEQKFQELETKREERDAYLATLQYDTDTFYVTELSYGKKVTNAVLVNPNTNDTVRRTVPGYTKVGDGIAREQGIDPNTKKIIVSKYHNLQR